jgi:hypothetical protein
MRLLIVGAALVAARARKKGGHKARPYGDNRRAQFGLEGGKLRARKNQMAIYQMAIWGGGT